MIDTNSPLKLNPDWPESVRQAHLYDRLEIWGERFNSGYAEHYSQRREKILAALTRHCPAPARLLDLAAAGGNFSIAAAELGYDVVWNDLRGELETYVRLKAPADSSIEYMTGNILELGDKWHKSVDAVMALEVIEHVAHPDEFLSKLSKLVKPGGPIIVSTPNGAYFRNNLPRFSDFPDPSVFEDVQFKPNSDGHIFLLYEDEMRSLGERAGLKMIDYQQFTNPLSAGHVKTHYVHRALPKGLISMIERTSQKLPQSLKSKLMCSSLAVYSQ